MVVFKYLIQRHCDCNQVKIIVLYLTLDKELNYDNNYVVSQTVSQTPAKNNRPESQFKFNLSLESFFGT